MLGPESADQLHAFVVGVHQSLVAVGQNQVAHPRARFDGGDETPVVDRHVVAHLEEIGPQRILGMTDAENGAASDMLSTSTSSTSGEIASFPATSVASARNS